MERAGCLAGEGPLKFGPPIPLSEPCGCECESESEDLGCLWIG